MKRFEWKGFFFGFAEKRMDRRRCWIIQMHILSRFWYIRLSVVLTVRPDDVYIINSFAL